MTDDIVTVISTPRGFGLTFSSEENLKLFIEQMQGLLKFKKKNNKNFPAVWLLSTDEILDVYRDETANIIKDMAKQIRPMAG